MDEWSDYYIEMIYSVIEYVREFEKVNIRSESINLKKKDLCIIKNYMSDITVDNQVLLDTFYYSHKDDVNVRHITNYVKRIFSVDYNGDIISCKLVKKIENDLNNYLESL